MKTHCSPSRPRPGFSLIEIMVTVGLLSFIILGLLAVFNQTQRAFKASMNDVDVLESGRIMMDMITREVEQTTPAREPFGYNVSGLVVDRGITNFFVEQSPGFNTAVVQGLPGLAEGGRAQFRTNVFERFFFLSRVNQDWLGVGYQVVPEYPGAPVGTLYRYASNAPRGGRITLATDFARTFDSGRYTNHSRVADGVVHLRVTPYDKRGLRISDLWPTNRAMLLNTYREPVPNRAGVQAWFYSNAVPAFVDVELGILSPATLQRFRAIGPENPVAQLNYLSNHVADVQLFRQRVPIRNADFSVYQ